MVTVLVAYCSFVSFSLGVIAGLVLTGLISGDVDDDYLMEVEEQQID